MKVATLNPIRIYFEVHFKQKDSKSLIASIKYVLDRKTVGLIHSLVLVRFMPDIKKPYCLKIVFSTLDLHQSFIAI